MSLIEAAKALLETLCEDDHERIDCAARYPAGPCSCGYDDLLAKRIEALRLTLTEALALPGREEIARDGELIDSVLRWACEPTPGDPTLAECIAAHDALERIIALALQLPPPPKPEVEG